jgi:hypothetical protein
MAWPTLNGLSSPDRAAPRSLLGWLPVCWSRVLFPGMAPGTCTPCHPIALLILIVLPACLLYPRLGFRLFEPDESRYAEISREMLLRHEVVIPYLQGQPYLDKPPLLYWLVMGSYRLFGPHDWAARLVPTLAIHGCVLLVYLLGRRRLGERAAFWGALALTLAPGFLSMGRLLLLDGLLTFFTTLALFSALEAYDGPRLRWGWWFLASVACGLGVLTKGPVAVLLLLPPLWIYRRLTAPGRSLGWRPLLVFAFVVIGISLPWYAALAQRSPKFLRYFFWEQNVLRFLSPGEHVHGSLFYVPVLLAGLLPATLLLVPFLRFLLSSNAEIARRRPLELGFLLLAGGWCVLFFSLSMCKLPTYILPALPPLALALGYFLAHSRWARSRWTPIMAGVTFILLLGFHDFVLPWYANYRSPMARFQEVVRLCGDRQTPIVCYPRSCDSVAFYLGRDDLRCYRSKSVEELRRQVRLNPRTVVLCTHRHSLRGLKQLLPPDVRVVDEVRLELTELPQLPHWLRKPTVHLMGETALGLCDVAVIERIDNPPVMLLALKQN